MIRNATVITLLTATALGLTLFAFKYKVQGLEDEYTNLNRAIIADRQAIHVLRAEWSHLNEPRRLKELSSRILDLRPMDPAQVGTIATLPDNRPRQESKKAVASAQRQETAKTVFPTVAADIDNDDFTRIISQALADRRSSR